MKAKIKVKASNQNQGETKMNMATKIKRATAIVRHGLKGPTEYINGFGEARVEGESWHYTTITGIPIRHPSAYKKRGWSSMVYHHSTRKVLVPIGTVLETANKI
jgi:hypothetical protein